MKDDKQPNTFLSKSLFMRGLQCHKSLYLFKYHQDLRDKPTEEQEALFSAGHEVGKLAQQLFPGGVEIPYEENNYPGQVLKTQEAIKKGIDVIYEATFTFQDIFVKVDILRKNSEGWEIYEVKSATSLSNIYIDDTAIQYYVLTGAGLTVSRASVVHINNQYVRNGDIEVDKLFSVVDITEAVKEKQPFVSESISEMRGALSSAIPDIDIGEQCENPYLCDFKGHCWQHIPPHSVFDLGRRGVNKFNLYRQGIIEMKDIPLGMLNRQQKIQVEAFISKKPLVVPDEIRKFLDSLHYPMCFLDFETFYSAVPLFDGIRPYQQITFQYSLHSIENEQAELKHSEFLAEKGRDPRPELIARLLDEIPKVACIIVYTDFESQRLRELAAQFPEHKDRINHLIGNIRDLSAPFRNMNYYHWELNGSYSIKAILPHLVPETNYNGLAISGGTMAKDAYFRIHESDDPEEIKKLRDDLLEYCRLDTLGMVMILDKLRELSKIGR